MWNVTSVVTGKYSCLNYTYLNGCTSYGVYGESNMIMQKKNISRTNAMPDWPSSSQITKQRQPYIYIYLYIHSNKGFRARISQNAYISCTQVTSQ